MPSRLTLITIWVLVFLCSVLQAVGRNKLATTTIFKGEIIAYVKQANKIVSLLFYT